MKTVSHPLLTVPVSHHVGLTSISLGLVRFLDRHGVPVAFYKPVEQLRYGPKHLAGFDIERSSALVRVTTQLNPPKPMPADEAERLLADGAQDVLQERIIETYSELAKDTGAVVIEGLVPTDRHPFAGQINHIIADALDAEVVLIADGNQSDSGSVAGDVRIAAAEYGRNVTGCILNRAGCSSLETPPDMSAVLARAGQNNQHRGHFDQELTAIAATGIRPLGAVPFIEDFGAPRLSDVAAQIDARIVSKGDWEKRRVRRTAICGMRIDHAYRSFKHGNLLVVPGDRDEIMIGASLATLNGVQLAGIIFSGEQVPNEEVMSFCSQAIKTGLPLLHVPTTTYGVAKLLHELNDEIPPTDRERASLVMNTVANHIDTDWVAELSSGREQSRMSPPAFRHNLVEGARALNRRIVLPEGTEPRILRAARVCADMGVARPVLLGEREDVQVAARKAGIELPDDVEIVGMQNPPRKYIDKLIELRGHKGIDTPEKAIEVLSDITTYGTVMMKCGDVDGLVSGSVHSTARTIRPALQLIKTHAHASIVSSVFFMCLPSQVLVFGDCAVNPNPNADQLADIAIQSADSAKAFGIEPRVAMLSYSTGDSGSGSDVDKVREATLRAQELRPDLIIDGPLQYDAAVNPHVAATKAAGSSVAGSATVLVFPDLNTGNTTYKAVQRSAGVLSIGPMLQGLALPVNDLSRGATVEDIVYTIALTAVQSAHTA